MSKKVNKKSSVEELEDWELRVVEEYKDLMHKFYKLNMKLKDAQENPNTFGLLGLQMYSVLLMQKNAMANYAYWLKKRMDMLNISSSVYTENKNKEKETKKHRNRKNPIKLDKIEEKGEIVVASKEEIPATIKFTEEDSNNITQE